MVKCFTLVSVFIFTTIQAGFSQKDLSSSSTNILNGQVFYIFDSVFNFTAIHAGFPEI